MFQIFVVPLSPLLDGGTCPSSYGGACRATNARLIVMLMLISLHADNTTSSTSSFTAEARNTLTVAVSEAVNKRRLSVSANISNANSRFLFSHGNPVGMRMV